jgi:hypothetical protein
LRIDTGRRYTGRLQANLTRTTIAIVIAKMMMNGSQVAKNLGKLAESEVEITLTIEQNKNNK